MKKVIVLSVLLLSFTASVCFAELITHTPFDAPSVLASPAFGALVPGGEVGSALISFGVDYTYGNIEGIFDDPPLAFGGVNAFGNIDLTTAVDGRIVFLDSLNQGLTDRLIIEAGFADADALLLEAFDINGGLLATDLFNVPVGPNDRFTAEIDLFGDFAIAFFRVSGEDSFGVNQVQIERPIAAAAVPEPTTLVLLGAGLLGLAALGRRKLQ